jgi:hypothetical protein
MKNHFLFILFALFSWTLISGFTLLSFLWFSRVLKSSCFSYFLILLIVFSRLALMPEADSDQGVRPQQIWVRCPIATG